MDHGCRPHGFKGKLKEGGESKECQRNVSRSLDTNGLSRSDVVLSLKNFKKDATLIKASSTSNSRMVSMRHVGPAVTSLHKMAKVSRWRRETRLCLGDDIKMLKITMSFTKLKEQASIQNHRSLQKFS
ncbi:hypothetical protein Tco_0957614 [Tanacetum coccineum]